MKTTFTTYDLPSIARHLATQLDVPLDEQCREVSLTLPDSVGKGNFYVFNFKCGVGLLLADLHLHTHWDWHFFTETESPLHFHLVLRGAVQYAFNLNEQTRFLHPAQTLFTPHSPGSVHTISFLSGQHIRYAALQVRCGEYSEYLDCHKTEGMQEDWQRFTALASVYAFRQWKEQGLSAAVLVREILINRQEGIIRSIVIESKILELLSFELRRITGYRRQTGSAAKIKPADRDRILHARDLLIADLRDAPTIEQLAKRAGVNRQKLKQQFKEVFEKTVNEYLTDERMELAKRQLTEGERNIRTLAHQVGYENPSYFSRLFREKFGVLPGDYLKNLQNEASGK